MKSFNAKEFAIASLASAIVKLDKVNEGRFSNSLGSDNLGFGKSSLANISQDGELFAELGGDGYSVESVEWYEKQIAAKKKYTAAGARALLEANGQYVDMEMSDELIMLVAEQFLDGSSNIKGYTSNRAEGVLVIVQYKGSDNRWYTVKQNDKKMTYWYDVETLFDKAEGVVSGLKMGLGYERKIDLVNKKVIKVPTQMPVILADMIGLGHIVNGESGRVLLKSSSFVRGTTICGQLIEEVPASFDHKYVAGEVIIEETNYAWDAIVEVCAGIAILPSDSDTTIAKADEMAHDDNIITGQAVVTNAMSSYYMDIGDRYIQEREAEEVEAIGRRERTKSLVKKYDIIAKVNSSAGEVAKFIIDVSYVDPKVAIEIAEKELAQLPAIIAAMWAIKTSTGKQAEYSVYKQIKALADELKKAEEKAAGKELIKRAPEKHVMINIRNLNNDTLDMNQMTDADIIETYETALANYTTNVACNLEAHVRVPMRNRFLSIKKTMLQAEAKAKFPVSA